MPPTQSIPGLGKPLSYVVLHSGAGGRYGKWSDDCGTLANCLKTMKAIQHYDVYEKGE